MGKSWKTIEPGVWKPAKEGDKIEGVLISKEPKNENANLSAKYSIENKEGMFLIWGCTILDDRMQYVKVGQEIRITYKGQTQNQRGQKVNLYEVAVAETEQGMEEGSDNSVIGAIPIEKI